MEKLAYGLSLLTFFYIVFLYLTVKALPKDSSKAAKSAKKKQSKNENRPINI